MPDFNSKEFADTMALLSGGIGVAGLGIGGGKMISDSLKSSAKTQQKFDARVQSKFKSLSVSQLNPRQLSALKYMGITIDPTNVNAKVADLEITPPGALEPMRFGEYVFKHQDGVYGKNPNKNDKVGQTRRLAMQEIVTPLEQEIIKADKGQLKNKTATAKAVSTHLHEGGGAPRINKTPTQVHSYVPMGTDPETFAWKPGTLTINPESGAEFLKPGDTARQMYIDNPASANALRLGATGSTASNSALITNESFFDPQRQFTMQGIRGNLPPSHPSYPRQRPAMPVASEPVTPQPSVVFEGEPPMLAGHPTPMAEPAGQPAPVDPRGVLPPAVNTGWDGPDSRVGRQKEYAATSAARRKVNSLFVPNRGLRENATNFGKNVARGIKNAPTSSKVLTGVGSVALPIAMWWGNQTADTRAGEIAKQVTPPTPTTPSSNQTLMPKPDEQAIIDAWNSQHGALSDKEKRKLAEREVASNGRYAASSRIWLKYAPR